VGGRAVGDVAGRDDDAGDVRVVEQVHPGELDCLPVPVGTPGPELAGLAEPRCLDDAPQEGVGLVDVVGVGEVEGAALVPELGRVPQDLLHLARAVEEVALRVDHRHRVSDLVYEHAEGVVVPCRPICGVDPSGIVHHDEGGDALLALIEHRCERHPATEGRAVGAMTRELEVRELVPGEGLDPSVPGVGEAADRHASAEHPFDGPAEGPGRGGAPGAHGAVEVEGEGDERGPRGDGVELLFGAAQRVECLALVGDVACVGHGGDRLTGVVLEHGGITGDMADPAGFGGDPELETDGRAGTGTGRLEALEGCLSVVGHHDVEQVHLARLARGPLDLGGEGRVRVHDAPGEVEHGDAAGRRGHGGGVPVGRHRLGARLLRRGCSGSLWRGAWLSVPHGSSQVDGTSRNGDAASHSRSIRATGRR